MEIDEKKKILHYLIDTVFVMQVLPEMDKFVDEFRKEAEYKKNYELLTGYPISSEKVVHLDLRKPLADLEKNIILSLLKE
jgi:hypothetical protein